jgi:hypothetical protein
MTNGACNGSFECEHDPRVILLGLPPVGGTELVRWQLLQFAGATIGARVVLPCVTRNLVDAAGWHPATLSRTDEISNGVFKSLAGFRKFLGRMFVEYVLALPFVQSLNNREPVWGHLDMHCFLDVPENCCGVSIQSKIPPHLFNRRDKRIIRTSRNGGTL